MHYFNNPIKTYNKTVLPHPVDMDPIVESMHNGAHCLFYNPKFNHNMINYQQKLQDLCDWANINVKLIDTENADYHTLDFYTLLVRINLWVTDIKTQGIVKPMLIYYDGEFTSGTGESRLRTLECIPEVAHVTAFITTHQQHAHKFSHLEPVTTFARFAEICKSTLGQQFMFRFTDKLAPYGIEWFDYTDNRTGKVMPSEELCVRAIKNYFDAHPSVEFTHEWFNVPVDWNLYR
jgi:hypothetical protein